MVMLFMDYRHAEFLDWVGNSVAWGGPKLAYGEQPTIASDEDVKQTLKLVRHSMLHSSKPTFWSRLIWTC